MVAALAQLSQTEQHDADITRLLLYTDLPPYDSFPLISEMPRFMETVKTIAQKVQGQMTPEERMALATAFNEAAGRFGPLAESEYNQQQAMLDKLKKEIAADKQLKKLFR